MIFGFSASSSVEASYANNYYPRNNFEETAWGDIEESKSIFYGKLVKAKTHQNKDVTITLDFQQNSSKFLMLKPEFVPGEGSYIWVKYDTSNTTSEGPVLIDMGLDDRV